MSQRADKGPLTRRTALVVVVGLVVPGLLSVSVGGASADLLVSAAISLEPALRDAATACARDEHCGVLVRLNTGGSSVLMQQVRRGAPVDLYIGASPVEFDRLEREGRLVAGTRRAIASNALVIVVPAGRTAPSSVAALADPGYTRIAVANPRTAPLGRYTRAALDSMGLLPAIAHRLVLAENARQVLNWVARGEAVGIVYRTDATLLPDRVTVGPSIPESSHPPIRYEAAVIADAQLPDQAAAFLDFLTSDRGIALLRQHGFVPPR